jgi:small subunit ribosomal protein S4
MEKQLRSNPPGMHAWRRSKGSNYAIRLREKQKVKRYYSLYERQFMIYFRRAERLKGNTGTALLQLLERRLDNVVYKSGFAPSRKGGRVMVGQGHIYVNGRCVDRPSFSINQGDRITIKPSDKSKKFVKSNMSISEGRDLQPWLQVDTNNLEITVAALPTRDDVQIPIEEQLIVEMCSR